MKDNNDLRMTLKAALDNLWSRISGIFGTVNGRFDDAEDRIDDIETDVSGVTSRVEGVETRMTTAEGQITGLDGRVDDLEDAMGDIEGDMIKSISLNGVNVPKDAQGNVALQETDPTVPSWAKQSSKPSYTAQEVGALPANTPIPSKTSDLTNDSGFLTSSTGVTGVKGDAESSYRQGNVNLTPANIGAVAKSGDTMTGSLYVPNMVVRSGSWQFYFMQDANGAEVGHVRGDEAAHHIAFREITPGTNVAYEDYFLPNPTIQSGPAGYSILTTKSPVGIPQGGTGATTAAGARANLEITPANIGAVAKSGDTMTGSLTIKGSWPGYNLQPNNGSQTTVSFVASDTDGHGFFETRSLDGTKHEWYNLPNSTTNGGYYNILTDKSPVTIPQGGTGATDAPGARANLGIATTVTTFQTNGITANGNFNTGLRPSQHVIDAIYCTAGHIAITPYCNDNDYWFAHCIHPTTGAVITTNFQVTIRYHNIY